MALDARSAFRRRAIEAALDRYRPARLDEDHRRAYTAVPETPAEVAEHRSLEKGQDWGEDWDVGKR